MIFNEFVASAMPTMTFRGYRLFAVDGSDLRLPSDPTNDFSLIRNMDGQKQYNLAHLNAMFDLMSKAYVINIASAMPEIITHLIFRDTLF